MKSKLFPQTVSDSIRLPRRRNYLPFFQALRSQCELLVNLDRQNNFFASARISASPRLRRLFLFRRVGRVNEKPNGRIAGARSNISKKDALQSRETAEERMEISCAGENFAAKAHVERNSTRSFREMRARAEHGTARKKRATQFAGKFSRFSRRTSGPHTIERALNPRRRRGFLPQRP